MKPYKKQYLTILYRLADSLNTFLSAHPDLFLKAVVNPMLDTEEGEFDIIVQEQKTGNHIIVINVCQTKGVQDCYSRLMIRQVILPIEEIFVYDYQRDSWIANNCAESSYSFILGTDLTNFIK